jgi:hypothetical protein
MFGWYLCNIKRYPEYIRIGLSKMDEAGGYEKIHKMIQMKFLYPVLIQLPGFIIDYG